MSRVTADPAAWFNPAGTAAGKANAGRISEILSEYAEGIQSPYFANRYEFTAPATAMYVGRVG